MNITAVVLLAATAVTGAVLWYATDRRRDTITPGTAALAVTVPALLLGAAGLFALGGSAPSDAMVATATAAAVVAAVPGGGLLAAGILHIAGRRRSSDRRAAAPASASHVDSADDAGHTNEATTAVPSAPPPPPPPPPPVMPLALAGSSLPGAATQLSAYGVSDPETLRGGAIIGALERVAVVVTLLAGWPEGLALVLALKGFGRYSELRRPSAPERFIVGTFTSILWAVAVAGVVVALRG